MMSKNFYFNQISTYAHQQRQQGGMWFIWMVVLPVTPIFAYALLGYLRILPSDDAIPKHIYIIVGVTIWLLLSDAVIQPSKSIDRFKQFFIRREIDLSTLLAAWLPERGINAVLQMVVCMLFVVPFAGFNVLNFILFCYVVLSGFLLFYCLGVFAAVVILLVPSVRGVLETVNRFLIFLSAVVFPINEGVGAAYYLKVLNPYYVFIDSSRLALFGLDVDWDLIAMWLGGLFFASLFLRLRLNAIAADVRDYLQ